MLQNGYCMLREKYLDTFLQAAKYLGVPIVKESSGQKR